MSLPALNTLHGADLPIPGAEPWFADASDPAIGVMTDFRQRASVTVQESATIDAALEHMKHTGVRCAFVINAEQQAVVGLITAYDIVSEKPMRHMVAIDGPRGEVFVRDIMLRIAEWRVADIAQVEQATVGSMQQLFEKTGLTHLPVMELGEHGKQRLRGLLSGAKIRRLLGR